MTPDTTSLIRAVENAGVTKGSISDVLATGRTGTPGLCHTPNGLNGALIPDGFCWDKTDDESTYGEGGGGWMPQGFTTADGAYVGRSLTITSWYHGTYVRDREPPAIEDYARISIAESTPTRVRYGHVALVEPAAGGTFKPLTFRTHADGIAWYGDRLFVANGAELQIYDLTHLWRMTDTAGDGTGLTAGRSSARGHLWALPLVARYSTVGTAQVDTESSAFDKDNPRACGPAVANYLCLSSLSLDRAGVTPALVSAENRTKPGGRVVRWPLTALGAGTPSTVASEPEGYISPVGGIQGTATDGTSYYMSGTCPLSYPSADTLYACIFVAAPGETPRVLTQAPRLTEGLSWDPRAKRLWGTNEAVPSAGHALRVVFSLNPGAGAAVDGWGWLTNYHMAGSACATPEGNDTGLGTKIAVWTCTGSDLQRWRYDNGLIVHKVSGLCLTPAGNGADAQGTVLTLWTCDGASDVQRFSAGPDGSLVNPWGKGLTPSGNDVEKGRYLTLWTKGTPTPDVQDWVIKGF
ncbi:MULTISPECIES: RICIN domain-containing protein [unclassified Actinoplanes]|uniref:RICIN domain-containing protein n=1 Tax=unclassified Actinoplanes TaxID=2626549 RepID=UPI0002EFF1EC|nr:MULTISPECIES: RICIN domain-containing protein [unclassified Actinoplanes]